MCAYTFTIKVDLLHKELCSGCPCNADKCTFAYWDERKYIWYNWRTGEMQEPSDADYSLSKAEGWGYHTKRPKECIEAFQ